jgi:prolyl-tRNA editing enzyme YbaK/EbsC (Cys-tRNA(Pro) deacylase)
MREYEEKLRRIIEERGIEAEHLSFDQSCHSVEDAARTVGAEPEDFIKSICMVDGDGGVIVAIVKGEDRASTSRVGRALGIERPRVADPHEILDLTGFPVAAPPASALTPCSWWTPAFWIRISSTSAVALSALSSGCPPTSS